jgi:hypothetical protein
MREIVDVIEETVPEMEGKITFLGPISWRPIADGVRQTIEHLRTAVKAGKVDVDKILA